MQFPFRHTSTAFWLEFSRVLGEPPEGGQVMARGAAVKFRVRLGPGDAFGMEEGPGAPLATRQSCLGLLFPLEEGNLSVTQKSVDSEALFSI